MNGFHILRKLIKNVGAAEYVSDRCTDGARKMLYEWAQKVSDLQNEYRKEFDSSEAIVSVCHGCGMCCVPHLGTGGNITLGDAFYYSMLDIDFGKYAKQAKAEVSAAEAQSTSGTKYNHCLFWSPYSGCKLPSNARPHACNKYVCTVNLPFRQNLKLAAISDELDELYNSIPLEIDAGKIEKDKKYESKD